MPGSQEASLDENAVILPVKPSSPEFLYSERERQSVEKLLCEGPKAFYNSVGAGLFGSFLSPDEVGEITSWVKDFHFTPLQKKENGGTADPHEEDLTSSYFPSYSDAPVPGLELGWPEAPWVRMENVSVYTNPPAEGGPPIREVIRRHLQKASQVLGIVTDRLTDSTIIGDLHGAASRGVPVYIILNQRTSEEKYTFQRLGHPNIRVRLLGGKSFCSRKGKMMVGELKDKFILVDLVTVIHGNYSLTWTDAHLHRHIISVINGSAVDSFDKEFRMLFAASAPVPNLWEYAVPHVDMTKARNDFTDPSPPRHFHIKHEILNPPSPPMDTNLDWEAMGVIPRGTYPDSLEEGGIVATRETRRVKPDPNLDDISTTIENKAASRKPLILKVPQSESFSSLSDLMKRFTTKQNKVDLFSRGSRNSMTDITQSMMDLREDAPDAGRAPDERRFSMSRINDKSYDQDQMTPGLILMKRRNDVVSSALQRIPKTFLPGDRLRSSGLDLNWKPLKESKEEGDK
nr:protein FAM83E-like [Nerophis lumbriciformis]